MNDDTPAPYGEVTRRWSQLSEADRDHQARRLLGVPRLQARIERPTATSTHYRHLVEAAVADDDVAFAWLAASHRPLLIARGRALLRDDPTEWGAAALEVLHTTLHRVDPAEGRWLRSTVAQRLSARMNVEVRRHIDRQDREELTDPTRLHIHLPPDPDSRDVHTELSAALADMLGRLDDPTRDGLQALAERQPLEAVAAEHGITHAALRQRITRARHRLQPQLAPFMRTVA